MGSKVFHNKYGRGKILIYSLDKENCLVSFRNDIIRWVYIDDLMSDTLLVRLKHFIGKVR